MRCMVCLSGQAVPFGTAMVELSTDKPSRPGLVALLGPFWSEWGAFCWEGVPIPAP